MSKQLKCPLCHNVDGKNAAEVVGMCLGFSISGSVLFGLCAFWFEANTDKVSGLGGAQTAKTQPFVFCFYFGTMKKNPAPDRWFLLPCL